MINGKRVLALIPARGGSKRLPRKNILELGGKPLIAWTIEAAVNSGLIDKTIVSTDSQEIAKISKHYGAEVPFIRPDYLSCDIASSIDVVSHALEFLKQGNEEFSIVVLLQPTSPLRSAEHINGALSFFSEKNAQAVVSVTECEHSPLWSNELPGSLSMENFIREEVKNKRSQDLPKHFRLNGAIYISTKESVLKTGSFFPDHEGFAYIMDPQSSVDIDNKLDFDFASFLMKSKIVN